MTSTASRLPPDCGALPLSHTDAPPAFACDDTRAENGARAAVTIGPRRCRTCQAAACRRLLPHGLGQLPPHGHGAQACTSKCPRNAQGHRQQFARHGLASGTDRGASRRRVLVPEVPLHSRSHTRRLVAARVEHRVLDFGKGVLKRRQGTRDEPSRHTGKREGRARITRSGDTQRTRGAQSLGAHGVCRPRARRRCQRWRRCHTPGGGVNGGGGGGGGRGSLNARKLTLMGPGVVLTSSYQVL